MVDPLRDDRGAADSGAIAPDVAGVTPTEDPIVAEVRAVRDALFAEAGYDLGEFVRRVRVAQAGSNHAVVTLPPKLADTAA